MQKNVTQQLPLETWKHYLYVIDCSELKRQNSITSLHVKIKKYNALIWVTFTDWPLNLSASSFVNKVIKYVIVKQRTLVFDPHQFMFINPLTVVMLSIKCDPG